MKIKPNLFFVSMDTPKIDLWKKLDYYSLLDLSLEIKCIAWKKLNPYFLKQLHAIVLQHQLLPQKSTKYVSWKPNINGNIETNLFN